MNTALHKRVPLKHFVPDIAEECWKLDLYCLLTIAADEKTKPTVYKIIRALHARGFQSLGDVLEMNDCALRTIKGLGDKSKRTLLELLELASKQTDVLLRSPYGISEKHRA